MDVDQLLSPAERQRYAFALADLHGVQRLYIAPPPPGEPAARRPLHMDDCQVVYECSMYLPRS